MYLFGMRPVYALYLFITGNVYQYVWFDDGLLRNGELMSQDLDNLRKVCLTFLTP